MVKQMTPRTRFDLAAALSLSLLAGACALTSGQHAEALAALADMLARGTITQAQYDALLAALTGGGWGAALEVAAQIGLSIVGALTGVRLWRGPITNRHGLAEALIAAAEQPPEAPTPPAKGGA